MPNRDRPAKFKAREETKTRSFRKRACKRTAYGEKVSDNSAATHIQETEPNGCLACFFVRHHAKEGGFNAHYPYHTLFQGLILARIFTSVFLSDIIKRNWVFACYMLSEVSWERIFWSICKRNSYIFHLICQAGAIVLPSLKLLSSKSFFLLYGAFLRYTWSQTDALPPGEPFPRKPGVYHLRSTQEYWRRFHH
jgi:hypothetical protein